MKKWMYFIATGPAVVWLLAFVVLCLRSTVWPDSHGRFLLYFSPIAYFAMITSVGIVARNESSRILRFLLIALNVAVSLPCSWGLFITIFLLNCRFQT